MARAHADLTHEWIARTWDESAPGYDRLWGHGLRTKAEHRAWLELMRRLFGQAPLRLLDVGCGTGVASLLLARLGHDVSGVDLSPGMLARAADNATRAGLQIAFQQGSAEATGFPDATFDAVVSRQLLWSLPDPVHAIREWARVTKPGGRVVAIDGLWTDPRLSARLSVQAGTALARLRGVRYKRYDDPYWDRTDQLPLSTIRTLDPARNAFLRAGLRQVMAEHLDGIDQVERAHMPLHERLRARYRRYLVEGTVPH